MLHALALWGKAALDRFNGMFALALYDTIEKRLLLARDHAGIKPLYYLLTSKGWSLLPNMTRSWRIHGRRRLQTSKDGLALYLRLGYIPAPYACLKTLTCWSRVPGWK